MSFWKEDTVDADLVDEGDHEAILDDVILDETKDDPKLKLTWKFTREPFKGRKAWMNLTFSEKAWKFTRWQLSELELSSVAKEADTIHEAARMVFHALSSQIRTLNVTLKISHREWNGKTSIDAIIKSVNKQPEASESIPF